MLLRGIALKQCLQIGVANTGRMKRSSRSKTGQTGKVYSPPTISTRQQAIPRRQILLSKEEKQSEFFL